MTGDEYRRAMNALARDAKMDPASASGIERNLVTAMATRGSAHTRSSPGMKHIVRLPRLGGKRIAVTWRPWLPAAAAIVIVVGSVFVWRMNGPMVVGEHWAKAPRPSWTSAPAAKPPAQTIGHEALPPTVVEASHPARHVPIRKASPKVNVVRPTGFVELPWTAGLPAFESGEIVRMEVPVASLPAYGIDISSGADRPVEADILIGQDGLARAIRLVTSTARSTQ